jgi:lysozyme
MATINRKVLDISHHNTVKSWTEVKAAGIVGIIHKATEGTSYIDPDYADRFFNATNSGLLWGAYHFANGNDVTKQVDNFLRTVGINNETLYALDWEDDPGGNTMNRSQAQEFLELIEKKTGRKGVVYSGNTAKEKLGSDNYPYFGAHRLWLAQYGDAPVPQASWDQEWLWQYSDGQKGPSPRGCPGVTGYVDTNSWRGTDDELRKQWAGVEDGGGVKPEPEQSPLLTVQLTSDKPVRVALLLGPHVTMSDE